MEKQITTFLTFQENNAEEAMNFYTGLFDNSRIIDVQRYGKKTLSFFRAGNRQPFRIAISGHLDLKVGKVAAQV